jgi:capsule biosynthesis phosphatase
MRICIDLDGVLCELRKPRQSYADVKPLPGAVEKLRALRQAGHEVVIATARHMKSCDHNVGKVVARQGLVTLDWLKRHCFEYDEIWFGKPHCDVYVDDNAYRFTRWDEISSDGGSLPVSHEKQTAATAPPQP